jgi:hypothetical protein
LWCCMVPLAAPRADSSCIAASSSSNSRVVAPASLLTICSASCWWELLVSDVCGSSHLWWCGTILAGVAGLWVWQSAHACLRWARVKRHMRAPTSGQCRQPVSLLPGHCCSA